MYHFLRFGILRRFSYKVETSSIRVNVPIIKYQDLKIPKLKQPDQLVSQILASANIGGLTDPRDVDFILFKEKLCFKRIGKKTGTSLIIDFPKLEEEYWRS